MRHVSCAAYRDNADAIDARRRGFGRPAGVIVAPADAADPRALRVSRQ
jgi:hypothetical protein